MPVQIKKIDVATTMWLSVPTLGIYGMCQFFRAMRTYYSCAVFADDEDDTAHEHLFWIFVGLWIVGAATAFIAVGIFVMLIGIIIGAVLLSKVLQLRDRAMESLGTTSISRGSWSRTSHIWCWVLGELGCFIVVGLILLIIQGVQFFKEYNDFVSLYGEQQQRAVI